MQFMCDNAPEAAEEIRVVYIESMGRTISALFRAYHAQLMKLELEMANRHDLIAVEVWQIAHVYLASEAVTVLHTCFRQIACRPERISETVLKPLYFTGRSEKLALKSFARGILPTPMPILIRETIKIAERAGGDRN